MITQKQMLSDKPVIRCRLRVISCYHFSSLQRGHNVRT